MSSFYCPKCNKAIIDSPWKIPTGCIHFPVRDKLKEQIPPIFKELFNIK